MKDLETRLKEIEGLEEAVSNAMLKWRVNTSERSTVMIRLTKLRDIAVEQAKDNHALCKLNEQYVENVLAQNKEIEAGKYDIVCHKVKIDEMKAEIDRLARFIPVSEGMPPFGKVVLIQYAIGGKSYVDTGRLLSGKIYLCGNRVVDDVTGWREI